MKTSNRAVLFIIRLIAGAFGGYLGFLLTQMILGVVDSNTTGFSEQIIFLGISVGLLIYIVAITVFVIL
ncbi:MAG: hypothetical protein FWG51_02105, partial [Firmicutes bacterium]|nr:hypothetical protein [Bacillota bacterium]